MRATFATLCLLIAFHCTADFESDIVLNASDVVPGALLKGPNHAVSNDIPTNGLQNYYTVNSSFGEFGATGTGDLRVRIREIDALTYLESMSKTSVFLDALKATGIKSVESIVGIFTSPIKTLKGLPSGVQRLFSGWARSAERGARATKRTLTGAQEIDAQEFRKSNYLLSNNERSWAKQLKTDPYSTNAKLRSAISSMSIVQFIGGLPVELALPLGASLTLDIVGEIDGKIYQKTAAELEIDNRVCLAALDVEQANIDKFINADYLTPTLQTVFCTTATTLSDVANVSALATQLASGESYEASRFLLSTIGLLSWYHQTQEPLTEIIGDVSLPQAITRKNEHLVILPVDYLFWTEQTSQAIEALSNREDTAGHALWIIGRSSGTALEQLNSRHWQVHNIDNSPKLAAIYNSGLSQM